MQAKQYEIVDFNEKLRNKIDALHASYQNAAKRGYLRVLLLGRPGWGKTCTIATAPKPILIDCFDPDGTAPRRMASSIASGEIIVRDFAHDGRAGRLSVAPMSYKRWEVAYREMKDIGGFNYFATYAIDSFTNFENAVLAQVAWDSNNKGKAGIGDYHIQQLGILSVLEDICELPCHFICTGHLDRSDSGLEGMEVSLLATGKLTEKIPPQFMEIYCMRVTSLPGKPASYEMQIKPEGAWNARTKVLDEVLKSRIAPNLQEAIKLASFKHENKPIYRPTGDDHAHGD